LTELGGAKHEEIFGLPTDFGPIGLTDEALDTAIRTDALAMKGGNCLARLQRRQLTDKFLEPFVAARAERPNARVIYFYLRHWMITG
jgi:hypothetical protein